MNLEKALVKDASSKSSKGKFEIKKMQFQKPGFKKEKPLELKWYSFRKCSKSKKKIIPSIYISKGSIKPLNQKFPSIFIKVLNY